MRRSTDRRQKFLTSSCFYLFHLAFISGKFANVQSSKDISPDRGQMPALVFFLTAKNPFSEILRTPYSENHAPSSSIQGQIIFWKKFSLLPLLQESLAICWRLLLCDFNSQVRTPVAGDAPQVSRQGEVSQVNTNQLGRELTRGRRSHKSCPRVRFEYSYKYKYK